MLADVANPESVDEPVEHVVLRAFSIASSTFCALLSAIRSSPASSDLSLARTGRPVPSPVPSRPAARPACRRALRYETIFRCEMANRLARHPRRTIFALRRGSSRTSPSSSDDCRAAFRTIRSASRTASRADAPPWSYAERTEHVAGASISTVSRSRYVLAANLVKVVQRRVGNRHAGELHRTQLADRRERSDWPTCTSIFSTTVSACCALNLYAIAQRGDRDTSPSCSCRARTSSPWRRRRRFVVQLVALFGDFVPVFEGSRRIPLQTRDSGFTRRPSALRPCRNSHCEFENGVLR